MRARDQALRFFNEFRTFEGRLPEDGGTRAQPAMWHLLLGIALHQKHVADREKAQLEADKQDG